jgi:uracil-DNA glycosylase
MQKSIDIIINDLKSELKVSGWDKILTPFIESGAFNKITNNLVDLVEQKKRFTPKLKEVFTPFKETKLSDLKVVIVAQEPYPQFGVADGLAFSCSKTKIPEKSLKYIFTEIYGEDEGYNCDLKRWANQGVLLINASLTCEINKMGAHYTIWKPFTEYLFEMINRMDKDIVFVLMGRKAEFWQLKLPLQNILKCPHPASAAYKKGIWKANNIFNKINDELDKQGKPCIIW